MRFRHCSSLLLLSALLPVEALAAAPSVTVVNNAPGMNTIHWSHPPTPGWIYDYVVERQSPPAAWVFEVPDGSYSDLGLQPSTTYNYRVCQVDGASICSSWASVTTMPAASPTPAPNWSSPSFSNHTASLDTIQLWWTTPRSYDFFQVRMNGAQFRVDGSRFFQRGGLPSNTEYTFIVQGCDEAIFGSNCSGWSAPLVVRTRATVPPPPSDDGVIYGIEPDGDLLWYRHEGRTAGTFEWAAGARGILVGTSWNFKHVFPCGAGTIYAITESGDLLYYVHEGRGYPNADWWGNGAKVGDGWNFKQVFCGGADGVIYGVTDRGDLRWYKHTGRTSATNSWAPNSGATVGVGWKFRQVFGTAYGIIYGITEKASAVYRDSDGREVIPAIPGGDLLWYRHEGRDDGTFRWAANSGARVGIGWNFKEVFPAPDGVLYAITNPKESQIMDRDGVPFSIPGGDLLWYRHDGQEDGAFVWGAGSGNRVGIGWNFEQVFSVMH